MLLHPGKEIATRLESLGITQKAFSQQIGKRVSEINELIKGKRNITLAWDYLLSQFFQTELKYWLGRQIDYDYEQFLATVEKQEEKKADSDLEQSNPEAKADQQLPQTAGEQVSQEAQNEEEKKQLYRLQEIFLDF